MRLNPISRTPRVVADMMRRFDERCREQGVRLTAQRRAVFFVLVQDLSHPTIDQIHAHLKADWPSLPLPTVYRIVEDLALAGMIRRVASEEGPVRLDANMEKHQHLVCKACGGMEDWSFPALSKLSLPLEMPSGFSAEDYDIRITGFCHVCAEKNKKVLRQNASRRKNENKYWN